MAPGRKFSTSTSETSIRRQSTSLPRFALHVERDALLVAVDGEEIGRLVALVRRREGARVVALAGPLHLDHLGAEVAELHGAVGTRQHPGQVDDPKSFQRTHLLCLRFPERCLCVLRAGASPSALREQRVDVCRLRHWSRCSPARCTREELRQQYTNGRACSGLAGSIGSAGSSRWGVSMITNPHVRPRNTAVFPRPALAVVFAILATLLLADLAPRLAPGLLRFEHAMAELRTAMFSDRLATQHAGVAVVGISDQTLNDYKTRIPIDRGLLAKVIDALDAAGVKVIGIDILFFRPAPGDNEQVLIAALRRAKAKVVLGAADERIGLTAKEEEFQKNFFAQVGRATGYVNLASERDWVVRFKAAPAPDPSTPRASPRSWRRARAIRPTRCANALPGC